MRETALLVGPLTLWRGQFIRRNSLGWCWPIGAFRMEDRRRLRLLFQKMGVRFVRIHRGNGVAYIQVARK